MDNAQIGHELEDLEARLERLRALYEQYFLGLEKLEPTVLRKDVDRKLWVLRREQIRNTGLRFKFQMLIQRYNTYQQYWTRVVREIENGTYRRDVIKVAQRFGEKDAMTILGKRRAAQYKRLAENQIDRRRRLKGMTGEPEASAAEEDEIALSASDFELIEDEDTNDEQAAPTPPRGVPAVELLAEPDDDDDEHARPTPPRGMPAVRAAPVIAPPPREEAPAREAPPPPVIEAPVREAPPPAIEARDSLVPTARAASPAAAKQAPAAASKSRVAELAAQMRAKKQQAAQPKQPALELDLFGSDALAPKAPSAASKPEPVAVEKPAPAPVEKPEPAPAEKPAPAAMKPAPAPVEKPAPVVMRPAPSMTSPRPAPAGSAEALSEQKMRDIYAKYVGAKRAANESTAGLTYDKLAASLRAQADKLRTAHPSRSIDFEIVVKDGKTALRPVVK